MNDIYIQLDNNLTIVYYVICNLSCDYRKQSPN
jgi:hypothetical protein